MNILERMWAEITGNTHTHTHTHTHRVAVIINHYTFSSQLRVVLKPRGNSTEFGTNSNPGHYFGGYGCLSTLGVFG